MTRRPKPIRSGKDGCEPIATPCRIASATVLRITWGSPAWKPHATLAEVRYGMISSSAPRVQRPQLSPMSALRSMNLAIVGSFGISMRASAGGAPAPRRPAARPALSSRQHARERVDEAVHVLVGHREGARTESPLSQKNPLVHESEEHPHRHLPVLGPRRTIVGQRLRRPV